MTLPEKIQAVTEVFEQLDSDVTAFQAQSHLRCLPGCGKCCFKPDIEATVLEFLPFAMHIYKAGKAKAWLKTIRTTLSPLCVILNPEQQNGLCSEYAHRGLICRLFGFSGRKDKTGVPQFVTCKVIKTEQKEAYEAAIKDIAGGANLPVMSNYYMRLYMIDPDLGREFYPINVALRKAIETVVGYYSFRARRSA